MWYGRLMWREATLHLLTILPVSCIPAPIVCNGSLWPMAFCPQGSYGSEHNLSGCFRRLFRRERKQECCTVQKTTAEIVKSLPKPHLTKTVSVLQSILHRRVQKRTRTVLWFESKPALVWMDGTYAHLAPADCPFHCSPLFHTLHHYNRQGDTQHQSYKGGAALGKGWAELHL